VQATATDLKGRFSHDLAKSFEAACALGLTFNDDKPAKLVALASEFHKAFVFRYPVLTVDGELIVIGTVVSASDLLPLVKSLQDKVSPHVWDARVGAANSGNYPVEIWHMGGTHTD
jgi:hypothetical protein